MPLTESVPFNAATAAAEPPEEPPRTRSVSQGLLVRWNAELSVELPKANSSMLALPVMTASEAISFSITVALYGGLKLPSILDAQVVSVPLVCRAVKITGFCRWKFPELKILYHTAAAILTVRNAKQRQDRVSVSETGRFYGQKSARIRQ